MRSPARPRSCAELTKPRPATCSRHEQEYRRCASTLANMPLLLPSGPDLPASKDSTSARWCRAICLTSGRTGAAFGAGGATAYYNKDSFGDYVRAAITPGWLSQTSRTSGGASKAPQLDELSRMVQQLSLDVQRRNGAVTIVHGSERGCGVLAWTLASKG